MVEHAVEQLHRLSSANDELVEQAVSSLHSAMLLKLGRLRAGHTDPESVTSNAIDDDLDVLVGLGASCVESLPTELYELVPDDVDGDLIIEDDDNSSVLLPKTASSAPSLVQGPLGPRSSFDAGYSTPHKGVDLRTRPSHNFIEDSVDDDLTADHGRPIHLRHSCKTKKLDRCGNPSSSEQTVAHVISYLVNNTRGAVMSEEVFVNFCNTVKFIRSAQLPKLPCKNSNLRMFIDFLDVIKGAELACQLLRAIGSWRFLELYHELKDQKRDERQSLQKQVVRNRKAGKSASQARSVLLDTVHSNPPHTHCPSAKEAQKLQRQLDNHIEASKVWYDLCRTAGPAITVMMPILPRTK